MPRYTLIFGNGIGRSLDNGYYQLSSALSRVWKTNNNFTSVQKSLVVSVIPDLGDNDYPNSEEQLDILQVAVVAADFLSSFESDNVKWLNDDSRDLPQALRRFTHEVASYFHESEESLPPGFTTPLAAFVRKSASHVGVLNYDNLLYDTFLRQKVLNGYHDTLIDGFHRNGFDSDNLNRYREDEQSWYLHLHGSPLYIGNKKLMGADRENFSPTEQSHIVLTHVEHKPLIIEASPILKEYWKRLVMALKESEKCVLLGYSGCDSHLNEVISSRILDKEVVIIERANDETDDQRKQYWSRKLPDVNVVVIRENNILEFKDRDKI